MHFEPNVIYHVYNQGNNKRIVFPREDNYYYFKRKMRQYLLPFGDLLSWCLMPNHFHWQLYVKETKLPLAKLSNRHCSEKLVTLNESIGILLRSYTRGVNKENNWSGSIFRNETKAKSGLIDELITIEHPLFLGMSSYDFICFDYIHKNPQEAGLVKKPEDWHFSSAGEYAGQVSDGLCNQGLARELGLTRRESGGD